MGKTNGSLTNNGETDVVLARGAAVFKAAGTWGGGEFTISRRGGDGNYYDIVTADAITSDDTGEILIDFPPGTVSLLKATLAGATAPDIFWEFIGVVVPTNL